MSYYYFYRWLMTVWGSQQVLNTNSFITIQLLSAVYLVGKTVSEI